MEAKKILIGIGLVYLGYQLLKDNLKVDVEYAGYTEDHGEYFHVKVKYKGYEQIENSLYPMRGTNSFSLAPEEIGDGYELTYYIHTDENGDRSASVDILLNSKLVDTKKINFSKILREL